jgi:adenylylsulfate kinase-like enzyme
MKEKKIYWFTGQPGAGKTVLATMLKIILEKEYENEVFHIDGDELRRLFNNQKYGREGREENIKRAQDLAKFLLAQGYDVVVSLVAPYKELRESFKSDLKNLLVEFYVHTTDIRGREHFHTDEYEIPTENFINIDTTNIDQQESLNEIIKHI